jgi:membrane protein DedA with SNARE-associated domain
VDTILQYFFEYRYAVIFLGTFIEGEIILIVEGFLVSEGDLSFSSLVSLATTASVAGDNCFYWLGRSQAVGTKHPWCVRLVNFIGGKRLFKGEDFVRRHGGKSVFFLRKGYSLRSTAYYMLGLFLLGQAPTAPCVFEKGMRSGGLGLNRLAQESVKQQSSCA